MDWTENLLEPSRRLTVDDVAGARKACENEQPQPHYMVYGPGAYEAYLRFIEWLRGTPS